MSNVPADLRYATSHEWIQVAPNGEALVGITDHAQAALGDITFVQLPKVGASFKAGETFGVVESVKAASDLYLPVSGTVIAVNGELDAAPEKVNQDPYVSAWMLRIKLNDPSETDSLLDASAYQASLG